VLFSTVGELSSLAHSLGLGGAQIGFSLPIDD
jgi:hypothetical protein